MSHRSLTEAQGAVTAMWTIGFLIFLSIAFGIGAWLFFLWSVKSGQYDDVEGPKHRMLDEDEDEGRRQE